MKKALTLIFFIIFTLFGEERVVVDMFAGWGWYPLAPCYPTALYPYYTPMYYPHYYRRPLLPYDYPGHQGWYDDYPYYDPYTYGSMHYYSGVRFTLPPIRYFDPADYKLRAAPPGSAPLTLAAEDGISLQDERISRFLAGGCETNRTVEISQ